MTDGELDNLETLEREATPGPWAEWRDHSTIHANVTRNKPHMCEHGWANGRSMEITIDPEYQGVEEEDDAGEGLDSELMDQLAADRAAADRAFIVAARNALPALIADSRALAEARRDLALCRCKRVLRDAEVSPATTTPASTAGSET